MNSKGSESHVIYIVRNRHLATALLAAMFEQGSAMLFECKCIAIKGTDNAAQYYSSGANGLINRLSDCLPDY